jgi:rhomboid protease GluP
MIDRQKSGSAVCPNCGRLVSINAKECMNCGRKNPGLFGYGPALKRVLGKMSGIAQPIIITSVVLYIIALIIDPAAIFRSFGLFQLLSPSREALFRIGMTGSYPVAIGRWWTVITAIYLHGGILHILFNMLWLRNLGNPVEELFGTSRAFVIFTLSGIAGFILSNAFNIPITVGASGSIFGLLGALVYYGRKRGGVIGNAVFKQVGTWAAVMFLFGFMMSGVNNWAHAGGFIGGYLSAYWLGFHEIKPESQGHKILALACIVLTIISFGLALLLG